MAITREDNRDSPPAGVSRARFARLHPRLYLSAYGVVGLALAVACIWAFFGIADEIPEQGRLVNIDLAAAKWLQVHGTELGESIFVGVSYLGAQALIGLLAIGAIVLAARRDWRHLGALAITCGGGALLNGALKLAFHRTRPVFASEFHEVSWSFPSGHAMDSLIVYGLAGYWLGARFPRARVWIRLGAAALIGAIGFARIYLGVHYLSDVVAGYMGGFVWLSFCITGYRFAERRRVGPAGSDEHQQPASDSDASARR
ncbi:MAG: phosphatase PAP2 family protein [Gemmatimonadaceae bacterium]